MVENNMKTTRKQRFIGLPGLKATSCLTVVLLIFLETVLLSTVSNCAKTFFMHWNTSNSIFRIDNTDHIIDVNKGNLAFEYDQVHIICPVYEPGTFDNETEKYIIYNVSKVEYETCRITNANPRIIAICDKPQKLMYFTITFRPFTPQPGGLEFLPGNDYYFISTSSKDDLHRRIGGRCSTNNMKVVFKVCCAPEADSPNVTQSSSDNMPRANVTTITRQPNDRGGTMLTGNMTGGNNEGRIPPITINTSNVKSTMTWMPRDNDGNGYRHSIPVTSTISVQQYHPHPTSSRPVINSAINANKFNKNNNNNKSYNNNNYNHSNNAPSHKPTKKTNEYDKHPNEVVKNEELTYNNNGGFSLMGTKRRQTISYPPSFLFNWMPQQLSYIVLAMSIVFFLNYLSMIQSIFAPNIKRVRCRISVSAMTDLCANNSDTDETDDDCELASDKPACTAVERMVTMAAAAKTTDGTDNHQPKSTSTASVSNNNEHNKCDSYGSHNTDKTKSTVNIEHVTINDNFNNDDTDTINNTNTLAETMYNYEKNEIITIRQTAAAEETTTTTTTPETTPTLSTATATIFDGNYMRTTANSSNQSDANNAIRLNGPIYTTDALNALFHTTNYSDTLANNMKTTRKLTVNNNIKFNYTLKLENSNCIRYNFNEIDTHSSTAANCYVQPSSMHLHSDNMTDAIGRCVIETISTASIISNRDSCSGETLH